MRRTLNGLMTDRLKYIGEIQSQGSRHFIRSPMGGVSKRPSYLVLTLLSVLCYLYFPNLWSRREFFEVKERRKGGRKE